LAERQLLGTASLVLLAEDNKDTIAFLTDYLLTQGYRVVVARNGREALERARERRPELILTDIQMPEMEGLEATRRLRANPAFKDVPILALTALDMPGDREQCFEAGDNEYLNKPVNLKHLGNLIQAYLLKTQSL
jgi:CheY-like chemotaxis protein